MCGAGRAYLTWCYSLVRAYGQVSLRWRDLPRDDLLLQRECSFPSVGFPCEANGCSCCRPNLLLRPSSCLYQLRACMAGQADASTTDSTRMTEVWTTGRTTAFETRVGTRAEATAVPYGCSPPPVRSRADSSSQVHEFSADYPDADVRPLSHSLSSLSIRGALPTPPNVGGGTYSGQGPVTDRPQYDDRRSSRSEEHTSELQSQ